MEKISTGRFEELAYIWEPGDQYRGVLAKFDAFVQESPFHLWSPRQPIIADGRRLLIGIAIWSLLDLRLLDTLEDALQSGKIGSDRIDIFEMDGKWQMDKLKEYIPGLGKVFQSPVMGLWVDNTQVAAYSGAQARDYVLSLYGLTMSVAYGWIT